MWEQDQSPSREKVLKTGAPGRKYLCGTRDMVMSDFIS